MELSVKEFLDSVSNPNTRKEYKHGLKKFCDWYGKNAEEILELRKDDLTQRTGGTFVEYRNRAARFEKFLPQIFLVQHTANVSTENPMRSHKNGRPNMRKNMGEKTEFNTPHNAEHIAIAVTS